MAEKDLAARMHGSPVGAPEMNGHEVSSVDERCFEITGPRWNDRTSERRSCDAVEHSDSLTGITEDNFLLSCIHDRDAD